MDSHSRKNSQKSLGQDSGLPLSLVYVAKTPSLRKTECLAPPPKVPKSKLRYDSSKVDSREPMRFWGYLQSIGEGFGAEE